MEGDIAGDQSSSSFPVGDSAQEKGLPYVPKCYMIPFSEHPSSAPDNANVPVIDLGMLRGQDPERRLTVVKEIGLACRQIGFFQVVNHGICQRVVDDALRSAFEYFELPEEEKLKLMSNDVHQPIRYGTSLKDGVDRVFLKHYAHPLSDWIHLWPKNPPLYRKKMGNYCAETRKLAMELMGAITESLGLSPKYLSNKMEEGVQVMAVNCYPPCPNPEITLGILAHSDHSCLTIVLPSSSGLKIMSPHDRIWRAVPLVQGALQVLLGDHLEVLSNGLYKSVVHRVTLNSEKTRISLASLHSLAMDEKMATAKELLDDQHPKKYKESSLRDFLNFLSNNDTTDGKSFIDTLKIEN